MYNTVMAVAFSLDGKIVASVSWDKSVRLWDPATGKSCRVLRGHADYISAVMFSPNGKLVASASWDKTVAAYILCPFLCSFSPLSFT